MSLKREENRNGRREALPPSFSIFLVLCASALELSVKVTPQCVNGAAHVS